MARKVNRLNARQVATLATPGRHADGGGLYLSISPDGSRRRWVFLYRWHGKLKEMGLGGATFVSLAQARELAGKWRAELAAGRNPMDVRAEERRAQQTIPTLREVATDVHKSKSRAWRNAKVRSQWMTPLERYAARLMDSPVNEIATEDVLAVLTPIWTSKAETAARIRGRIEAVIDAARARGLIAQNEANPARWRGHLSHLLPKRQRLQRGHHAALAWQELPAFLQRLREREAVAANALEFLVFTAARTGEVLGAKWSEIDVEGRVWTVPGKRMKGGRDHRVPLSTGAIRVLAKMQELRTGDLIFPGTKPGRPLSNMSMEMLLRRMNEDGVTIHGFRSSFRDWAGDATNFPRELAEAALAHVAGDSTERAYRRKDALERRREMMESWSRFCNGEAAATIVRLGMGQS